jgi:hypothetical protein
MVVVDGVQSTCVICTIDVVEAVVVCLWVVFVEVDVLIVVGVFVEVLVGSVAVLVAFFELLVDFVEVLAVFVEVDVGSVKVYVVFAIVVVVAICAVLIGHPELEATVLLTKAHIQITLPNIVSFTKSLYEDSSSHLAIGRKTRVQIVKIRHITGTRSTRDLWPTNSVRERGRHRRGTRTQTDKSALIQFPTFTPAVCVIVIRLELIYRDLISIRNKLTGVVGLNGVGIAETIAFLHRRKI